MKYCLNIHNSPPLSLTFSGLQGYLSVLLDRHSTEIFKKSSA